MSSHIIMASQMCSNISSSSSSSFSSSPSPASTFSSPFASLFDEGIRHKGALIGARKCYDIYRDPNQKEAQVFIFFSSFFPFYSF